MKNAPNLVKKQQINLYDCLFALTVKLQAAQTAQLCFVESYQNDGITLRPEQLMIVFEMVVG
ncbi:MAG: hypothetical protein F6J87_06650 [Spirulina sp. SIO3F2]|nr:hypothetical protein [Spirulina sp. SIO3F2]